MEINLDSQVSTAIRVQSVVKNFGDVKAVDGVTLNIADGEFFANLGPSGASTTAFGPINSPVVIVVVTPLFGYTSARSGSASRFPKTDLREGGSDAMAR